MKATLKANTKPRVIYATPDTRYWVRIKKRISVPDYIKLKAKGWIMDYNNTRFRLVVKRHADKDSMDGELYSVAGEPRHVFKLLNLFLIYL